MRRPTCTFVRRLLIAIILGSALNCARAEDQAKPAVVQKFIEANCLDCHDSSSADAGLDLETLSFDLSDRKLFSTWVRVHDRVRDGEMPPPDDEPPTQVAPIGWSSRATSQATGDNTLVEERLMLRALAAPLAKFDRDRAETAGRAKVRRLNRFEYENTLRQTLDAPWLQISDMLPEDGVDHLFNKVGERLDVSHVQLSRYLATAERALRLAINAAAHSTTTRKFYARDESTMRSFLHYKFGQTSATRSIVPLLGTTPETEIIRRKQPVTVGGSDPQRREREAMGTFCGTYSATTKYDFSRINAPTDGRYRLRFKTYTFTAGPNGASGGDDHGLTGGNRSWWRPDRNVAFPGRRSEPITLYALAKSGDSRWLTTFDSLPEPSVFECIVTLRRGEGIRPDAARLVRTRPGWSGNPNASRDGIPGFAMNWLEVQGPLHDAWPPASYRAVFGDLPFEVVDGQLKVVTEDPKHDAEEAITSFHRRAMASHGSTYASSEPFLQVFQTATSLEQDFTDAVISALSAILCSPDYLYLESQPGRLSKEAFEQRLAYFLWNGPPETPTADEPVEEKVNRMLKDPRSERFIAAFLDYWLDLRDINANAPDAELYPDYYLDELLTESSVRETRLFFRALIDDDLPVRNLVDSDFAFVNERLAQHYGLDAAEGVEPRRIALPDSSPRGGLLTQSSILRVTANGTTTSPVVRGAWIAERILGVEIADPPSGVEAVEPDIRGATTIRQQLDKHRSIESCNACHAKFDPTGLALESFDVAGGWRDRYRSVGDTGEPVKGLGKNGHSFRFKLAQQVDCTGQLMSGESFDNVREWKGLMIADERQIARNLVNRLVVYATGAPVSFGDRAAIESILDQAEDSEYGVRTLIQRIVESKLFKNK